MKSASPADVVLVDLRMPGLSGMEVCKQIRAAGMNTPLIVLSAIEKLDADAMMDHVRDVEVSMCGVAAAASSASDSLRLASASTQRLRPAR